MELGGVYGTSCSARAKPSRDALCVLSGPVLDRAKRPLMCPFKFRPAFRECHVSAVNGLGVNGGVFIKTVTSMFKR